MDVYIDAGRASKQLRSKKMSSKSIYKITPPNLKGTRVARSFEDTGGVFGRFTRGVLGKAEDKKNEALAALDRKKNNVACDAKAKAYRASYITHMGLFGQSVDAQARRELDAATKIMNANENIINSRRKENKKQSGITGRTLKKRNDKIYKKTVKRILKANADRQKKRQAEAAARKAAAIAAEKDECHFDGDLKRPMEKFDGYSLFN